MKLSCLFEGAPKLEIKSLMTDSRVAGDKALFFCIKGMVNDGHRFVEQAKANGAVAIVHSDPFDIYDPELVYIRVKNVLDTLNQIAARFYEYCSQKMTVFGVTGTNGKSTIAWITRYLVNNWEPCGYIGTIAIIYGDQVEEEHLTTPEVDFLHGVLYRMYRSGMKAVSLEVSSQGLDMHRVDSVDFDCAVFTNLTRDHLDYHLNMENYYQAKQRLFTMIAAPKPAVINIDDEAGQRLAKETTGRVVTYAVTAPADYQAADIQLYSDHTDFRLIHGGEAISVSTDLVAMFNVYNLVAAIAAVHETLGYPLSELAELATHIPQVWGRVEKIEEGQPFNVYIDYAHTQDGIEKILSFAKSVTDPSKRIISVFGSAGARDSKKRPSMGAAADKYSSIIILTSEDPRNEDPAEIASQIQSGIKKATSMFIEDRYEAIRQGIELANPGDTVVIMGKGDENFQDEKIGKRPWIGDPKAAKDAVRKYYLEESEEREDENK